MLGLAWYFYHQSSLPMNGPTMAACVVCVAIGAALGVIPFILDYRAAVLLAEANGLANTVAQIQELDVVAKSISQATGQWQGVHQHANEAVTAARQVSEQMSGEMKSFMEFFEKANDSQRQHLTLEVDKLKRAESDWLGVLVRILDHVYALSSAAGRSADPKVVEQMGRFQLACRDVARRVGLIPFEAESGGTFDASKHTLPNQQQPPTEATIAATLATGYTFRGEMIRPALVQLTGTSEADPATEQHTPEQQSRSGSQSGPSTEQELAL